MESKPICPYCKSQLDKMPGRKKQCTTCGEFIYVRTGKLFTEKEAGNYDAVKEGLNSLESHGVSKKRFEKAKKKHSSPHVRNVIWGLFNELLRENMKTGNLQELKMIYGSMAVFLDYEGKDSHNCLAARAKMELTLLKRSHIEKVAVLGKGCCSACEQLEGKEYRTDDAIEKMPIPNPDCTRHSKSDKIFCGCIWLSVL